MSRSLPIPLLTLLFAVTSFAGDAPDGWKPFAVREEIAPKFTSDASVPARYSLTLNGDGNPSVDGHWGRRVAVSEGKHYVFSAGYRAENVETRTRSILARVLWFDSNNKQINVPEFPLTDPAIPASGWTRVTGTYQAPPKATQAQLELHLRWAPNGTVTWRNVTLTETDPPTPRKVRLATINHRPRNSSSLQKNLEAFAALIDKAGSEKPDIVCLPEGITVCGTRLKYADVAEAIPGPSTTFLGEVAKRNNTHVVAGIYERDGHAIYNTSVLLARDGSLLGKYRKVCLPREEIDGGITPGTEYPVFDTDFGRIGMMICWDLHYPEVARELSARGAEVIFMPIWGGNETLAKARAIENQIHLVASGYDFKSAIYDREGNAIQLATSDPQVLTHEIDLNARVLWPWLGDWRSRIWREGPARSDDK